MAEPFGVQAQAESEAAPSGAQPSTPKRGFEGDGSASKQPCLLVTVAGIGQSQQVNIPVVEDCIDLQDDDIADDVFDVNIEGECVAQQQDGKQLTDQQKKDIEYDLLRRKTYEVVPKQQMIDTIKDNP